MQITNSSSYNLAQQHGGIQKTIEQEVLQICFETLKKAVFKKVYEHSTVYLA